MKGRSGLASTQRRRVDWPLILGADVPVPQLINRSLHGKLADLLSAFDKLLALGEPNAILRRAVELAHQGGPEHSGDAHGRLVPAAVAMLAKDPSMGGKQIAARLDISLSRLVRVFKAQMGMSLVAYRNRLRLERFAALLANGRTTTLLDAALAAGFGSYAQFHRVFRALGQGRPRDYLRRHAAA